MSALYTRVPMDKTLMLIQKNLELYITLSEHTASPPGYCQLTGIVIELNIPSFSIGVLSLDTWFSLRLSSLIYRRLYMEDFGQ